MPFDWKEYLELAKDLAGQTNAGYSLEAKERSAVSRAYYAAFCHARNYAKVKLRFIPTGTAKDHIRLRDHFKKVKPQIASQLERLREWRNQCDYDDQVSNLGHLVRNALLTAESVVQKL